jgi:hypothetical protein
MISSYLLLFTAAFLANTILPFYSEVLVFALLREGGDPVDLVVIATFGNTPGAVVNWLLGRYPLHFQDRRWFYFRRGQIESAQRWYRRYGFRSRYSSDEQPLVYRHARESGHGEKRPHFAGHGLGCGFSGWAQGIAREVEVLTADCDEMAFRQSVVQGLAPGEQLSRIEKVGHR